MRTEREKYERFTEEGNIPDISWPAMARIDLDKYHEAAKKAFCWEVFNDNPTNA